MAPKKFALSAAESIYPKVFQECLCGPGWVLGTSNAGGPCHREAYTLSERQAVSKIANK